MMRFSFIGGVSFPGVPAPWFVWLRTEGYTACSLFTHLLRLPRLVFEDESGLSQQPVVCRTWAPRGETPLLTHVGSNWRRLSVAGALAFRWDGRRTRFLFHTQPGSYTDRELIAFLRNLKHHFRRHAVILIWDGLPAHKSRAMRAYLARQRAWLTVERLPGYAPELNPVELVWGYVKRRELANVCADTLDDLRAPLRRSCARLRHHPELAFSFLRHTGLVFNR
jgi:transposase